MRPREIVPIAIPNKVIKFCSINYKDKYSINLADDGTFVLSDLLKSCLGHKKQGFGPKIKYLQGTSSLGVKVEKGYDCSSEMSNENNNRKGQLRNKNLLLLEREIHLEKNSF